MLPIAALGALVIYLSGMVVTVIIIDWEHRWETNRPAPALPGLLQAAAWPMAVIRYVWAHLRA